MATSRPATSGAYLAASAAYNAGFRGWPLVIMTAIAGRESSWHPTSLNNNSSTGDYSVGLWQINYYGSLLDSRSAEYGTPQTLLANPQDQANAAYQLVGGNNLTGLSNWFLGASPKQGVVPSPTVSGYQITPYMPQALSAASEVGTFGPAPASQIAQASTWPGTTPLGSALTSGGDTSLNSTAAGILNAATNPQGCQSKGNVFKTGGVIGVGSFSFTYCELKALMGGLAIAAGGVIIIIGMASLVVGSLGGRGKGAAAIAPAIIVARAGGRGVRAVTPSRSRPTPAEDDREAAREDWTEKEGRPWSESDAAKSRKSA
jgi:hypothetical protein